MPKAKTGDTDAVPALVVTPSKAPVVGGNFEDIENYLQNWKRKVLSVEMTEDNMEEVRVIKREAVQYRNSLAAIQERTKKLYFNDPKTVFDAKMKKLLAVVGEVEKAADDVLVKEEQERVDGINEVLESYKAAFQEQFKLDDGYLAQVKYIKQFYNKTVPQGFASMDKFWKTELELQFQRLKKEQNAYAANVRLIRTNCKDDPRLNVQHYIEQLQCDDVAVIIENIIKERQRLHDLDTQPAQTKTGIGVGDAEYEVFDGDGQDTGDEGEGEPPLVIGVTSDINFTSDFEGRKKSLKIEITYPCDLGDALTEVFARLARHGITSKVIKEEEVMF